MNEKEKQEVLEKLESISNAILEKASAQCWERIMANAPPELEEIRKTPDGQNVHDLLESTFQMGFVKGVSFITFLLKKAGVEMGLVPFDSEGGSPIPSFNGKVGQS